MNKNKLIFRLFLSAIFLQAIPNFNFIGSDNILFTTNFLSLILIILLGVYLFFTSIFFASQIRQDNEGLLILIFLVFQLFSVVSVVTLYAYLEMFIKIISGVILYFVARSIFSESSNTRYQSKSHSLNTVISVAGILNILFQSSLLLYPDGTLQLVKNFFSKNLMEVTRFHYEINNKLYSNFPLEILPPILFLDFLTNKKIVKKISTYLYLTIIFILAIASNFRYRLVGYFVSMTCSVILFRQIIGKAYNHIFIYSLILGYIIFNFFTYFSKTTIINRFTDPEEYGKYSAVAFRLKMYKTAFDLGNSKLFGVGLGNMYDYVQKSMGSQVSINKQFTLFSFMGGAHNIILQIFAETGFFGLLSLIILLIFWLIKDLTLFRKGILKEKIVYVLMFWTLVFISQFIPAYNITFFIFFFLLRGLI